MKTFLMTLMAATALATASSAATTATVTDKYVFNKVGPDAQVVSADFVAPLKTSPFVVDLLLQDSIPVNANVRSGSIQQLEVGLTTPVVGPTFVRAGVGEAVHDYGYNYVVKCHSRVLNPVAVDHQYYNLTAGVALPVTNDLKLDASEKYENSFTQTNGFETWTTGAGATYVVNKKLSIRASYERQLGTSKANIFGIGANINF